MVNILWSYSLVISSTNLLLSYDINHFYSNPDTAQSDSLYISLICTSPCIFLCIFGQFLSNKKKDSKSEVQNRGRSEFLYRYLCVCLTHSNELGLNRNHHYIKTTRLSGLCVGLLH